MQEGMGRKSDGDSRDLRVGGTRICESHSGKFSSLKSLGVSYTQKL